MKKLLLFVLLPFLTYAQEYLVGELHFELINRGSSWNVTISLTAIGSRWDENYDLTENYGNLSANVTNPNYKADFDHILDPGSNLEFAVGLYKISAIVNSVERTYFFMDWRSSDWSASLDVSFKYDVGNNRFRNWGNTETIDYSYQTLWDLTNNYLETSGLEDYWDNCLGLTNDADDHPRFVFGPYPENLQGTITGYKIYRSATHIPGQEPSNFTLLETLESDEYLYTDNTVTIGNDYNAKSYYVTCVYEDPHESTGETDPTNTVEVRLEIPQKISIPESGPLKKFNYQLKQNYPNPFNPTTTINYKIPSSETVSIRIFDVLGREVTRLVDEQKEAGNHSIEFDASNLTSGIYFYHIKSGGYSETKKLILQK